MMCVGAEFVPSSVLPGAITAMQDNIQAAVMEDIEEILPATTNEPTQLLVLGLRRPIPAPAVQ